MSDYKGTFTQAFGTTEEHRCEQLDPAVVARMTAEIERLIDAGLLYAIPDQPQITLDDDARAFLKKTAMDALGFHIALMMGSVPTPWFRTAVEGGCADLAAATISLVNSGLDGIPSISIKVANIPAINGLSIGARIKAQVNAGRYTGPSECDESPRHLAWTVEKARIEAERARYEKAHDAWLRQMEAYREHLRKTGTAFREDGTPYPTPRWPDDSLGYPPTESLPKEPPAKGVCKARQFHVLWTLEIDVGVGVFGGTYQGTLFDHIYEVRTACCDT